MAGIGTIMPFALGGFLVLLGVFSLVFRRRMSENMAKSEQIPGESNYPALFVGGLAVLMLVMGVFFFVLAFMHADPAALDPRAGGDESDLGSETEEGAIDGFTVVFVTLGIALLLAAPVLIVLRRRLGGYMVAAGMGNSWGKKRPSVVAVGCGVLQLLLAGVLIAFGIINPHAVEPGSRAVWPALPSALFGLPLLIAFISLSGGAVGRWREGRSDRQFPGQRESLIVPEQAPISWRDSLRTGGAAFLIANGALAVIAWLWVLVMILVVAAR